MNICTLFSKIAESKTGPLFKDIIVYNDVKRLFRMALDSDEQSHILLSGPPASAKTMFLEFLEETKGFLFR
jgi:Holliday junction DNA helicase RuvB